MTALANLLALLSLDNTDYLEGLGESADETVSFTDQLSGFGGAVAVGGLSAAATAVGAVGVAAWEAGNQMDAAMDSITVATGATGPALDALRDDFETVFSSVPASAEATASALGILNTRLGATGDSLTDMTVPLLETVNLLGGDATARAENFSRLVGDWGLPLEEASQGLDKLFVAAQEGGVDIDQLMQRMVQFGAPMRQFGFSFEESAALLTKWEKEGVNTELVMGSLRIAAGKFADQGIDLKTGLWDTFEAIKAAGTETEALSLAMEAFGAKAGGDMSAAIREGRFSIDDLVGAMGQADGAILATAKKTADWGETVQTFMNGLTVSLAPIGEEMISGVGEIMDEVVGLFAREDVRMGISSFAEGAVAGISQLVDFLPVLIAGMSDFVTFLMDNQGIVVGVFAALGVAVMVWGWTTLIAGLTAMAGMLPVILILGLVGLAAYLLYEAWENNWGGIREVVGQAWEWLEPRLGDLQAWLAEKLPEAAQWLEAVWQNNLLPVLEAVGRWLGENLPRAAEALGQAWNRWITPLFAGLSSWWEQNGEAIMHIFSNLFMFWWNSVTSMGANIVNWFELFWAALNGDWRRVGEELRQILETSFGAWLENMGLLIENLTSWFGVLGNTIGDLIGGVDWGQLGRSMIEGWMAGLNEGLPNLLETLSNISQNVLDVVKGFFGIESPSKVFEAEVGYQMAAGMAVGYEGGMDEMQADMPGLLEPSIPAVAGGNNPGPGGGGGVVVNIMLAGDVGDEYATARRLADSIRIVMREEGVLA